jgi:hypothetical protein
MDDRDNDPQPGYFDGVMQPEVKRPSPAWGVVATLIAGLIGISIGGWMFYRSSEIASAAVQVQEEVLRLPEELSSVYENQDPATAPYDMVQRLSGTVVFTFWLEDSQTCRVQLVLPPTKQGGTPRRLILSQVAPTVCGRKQ